MRIKGLCLLFIVLGCVKYTKYIPDPEAHIEQWVENFTKQRSFVYCYFLQTEAVYTHAQGECLIGRIEHNRGTWQALDRTLDFEYYGLGDIQYSKSNGKWDLSTRGEESDVLTQITRVLEFDKFEYIGLNEGYLYNFKANIPFLAPGRWKEITGWLKISTRSYLPEEIWTGLPDSSVYWKIELSGYNKSKSMKPPVSEWCSYAFKLDPGYSKAIKRRFELLDIDYRLKESEKEIVLTVPKRFNIEDIVEILDNRRLVVYRVVEEKGAANKIAYLNDDKKAPVYLAESLFDQENIKKAKIKFDGASEPYIEISLHKKIMPPERVALEVDSMVVHTVVLDTKRKIGKINLYIDVSYYEMQKLIGGLLEYVPQVEVREVFKE